MIKILLVEDDLGLSNSVFDFLDDFADVMQVFDGEEGLYEAESGVYDLILLDLMLPEKDGFQVLKDLRAKGVTTPVLIMTAKESLDDKGHGFELGADDYLTKPFYLEELKIEEEFVQKYDLKDGNYFVLAPGASKFTKKWPYYDELAKKILENESKFVKNNENLRIFVIGGKEDANVVKADGDGRVIDLCGKISFKESGILLKYAKAAIVNDSGPFHIARAVKAKTFVFFGPTDPKLFSFEKNTFLLNNPSCPPHSLYGDDKFPKKYADCMTGISVETVFDKIVKEYDN